MGESSKLMKLIFEEGPKPLEEGEIETIRITILIIIVKSNRTINLL